MVDGMAEQERAHAVLREHGGHSMRYFGRWAITTSTTTPTDRDFSRPDREISDDRQ